MLSIKKLCGADEFCSGCCLKNNLPYRFPKVDFVVNSHHPFYRNMNALAAFGNS